MGRGSVFIGLPLELVMAGIDVMRLFRRNDLGFRV